MSSQVVGTASAPPARPYRRFIVPAMHRRFTNAAVLSLLVCFVDQLAMGPYTSFFQAVGITIVRTTLLFISILAIYVLRVGNMHVGERATASQAQYLSSYLLSMHALRCLGWYLVSAWLFSETYIWSASTWAELGIIDPGKMYEKPRLNERPIFLRSMFLCLATAQAAIHLVEDYDRISIPSKKPTLEAETLARGVHENFLTPVMGMKQGFPFMLGKSSRLVFLTAVFGPFFYWLFIRDRAWTWAYWATKAVFTLPKSSSRPPMFPPGLPGLTALFLFQGFLLTLAWEVANFLFDACLAQPPLKQGRLLTDESLDPNGTLLSGLKTNRSLPKTFAFWELQLVAKHFAVRRDLIYKDIDRLGGSAWAQTLTICLGEVHAIVKRIQEDKAATALPISNGSDAPLTNLPHLGTGVKDENIFTKPKPVPFSQFRGQDPNNKFVEASGRKLIGYAVQHAPAPQAIASKGSANGIYKAIALRILQSPVGIPFRQTLKRRACSVVLGSPASSISVIVDSITSVSKLVIHSKKEDKLGTVWRDVPNIIRTFTSTYTAIESFLKTLPVHWTDVSYSEQDRSVPEVELVLETLQDALREIVNEFGEFSDSMGMSSYELRMAKEVVAKSGGAGEEVRQIRR